MPVQQLPEEFNKTLGSPSNSSLSSTSSDVILVSPNYVRNSRSPSVSSGSTNINDDDSIDSSVNANNIRNRNVHNNDDIEEEETYQPIKLPTEPTLEELLVIFSCTHRSVKVLKCFFTCSAKLQERTTFQ